MFCYKDNPWYSVSKLQSHGIGPGLSDNDAARGSPSPTQQPAPNTDDRGSPAIREVGPDSNLQDRPIVPITEQQKPIMLVEELV